MNRIITKIPLKSIRKFSSLPSYVLNTPLTEITTTSNGIRVASETYHGETATVGVWIDAGSRYETEANNGVAHFLEHLSFKGTANRTQQQLEIEIENMGGHLNAYTSREQTVYYAKVFKNDVPKAIEILSDILQNSLLTEKSIEIERDVILREAEEVGKQYEETILDHLHETAFMNTGLGRTILGSEHNIKNIKRSDIVNYIQTHYTADRFVIAGAGAIDHKQLVELTDKYFNKLPSKSSNSLSTIYEPAIFTGSDKRIRFDSMSEAHVALAFQGASWTSEYAFPLMLIQTILGSWDRTSAVGKNSASKLARDIAEGEFAHSFVTFNTCYKDTGLFGVYLVAPDNKLDDLMWYTMDNLVRLCHEVTDEEVERAKVQLKANLLTQLDNFSSITEDIGRQILTYGRRVSTAETFARIDSLTTKDIRSTANHFINDEDHALAAVGPIFELPDYNWIRRRSYWHRY
uniref:mitochondrial processing peptidase n=1 Tax=Chromulina nebulosa TaxID=96789 RepID=A0A7S0STA1_9STRA|mmetsp:Transcript_1269/g.1116  ORF Transcript_1269/g.1116 Transcript_1269/m.1116 type:complete len:462 (+) Transcript_1269:50-1435(+)